MAGIAGLLGYLKVRKIKAPERTIETARESVEALRRGRSDAPPSV
jgi:hypothetical protein